ncbi:hypothetical protein [Flavobacterium sp. SOK18b]
MKIDVYDHAYYQRKEGKKEKFCSHILNFNLKRDCIQNG